MKEKRWLIDDYATVVIYEYANEKTLMGKKAAMRLVSGDDVLEPANSKNCSL